VQFCLRLIIPHDAKCTHGSRAALIYRKPREA
jgi:hypothetical protein